MRKLKLQMQLTLDGFIAGTNGEMDWMLFPWTEDIINLVQEITDPVDTILLGRTLAEGFIPHWIAALEAGELGAKKMVETPKVVFSKTLTTSNWERTKITNGDLVKEINSLKKQDGGDIITYGGGKFVSSLIKENLIDELYLFVNPTAIGKGMSIFQDLNEKQGYKFVFSKQFDCGIVVLKLIPKS